MEGPETTSWGLIQAATVDAREGSRFVERYAPAVRAFFMARWRNSPLIQDVDDAAQEVFLECFRRGGVIETADPERAGGFRPFFYGSLRNVAMRVEQRRARRKDRPWPDGLLDSGGAPAQVESPSQLFDREWAVATMRAAADRQAELAESRGDAARRRVELLKLRFQDGLPIREVARRWEVEASFLHHEYATARKEFVLALRDVVAAQVQPSQVDARLAEILDALGGPTPPSGG